jgi:SAM-dependent methyltransferase
VKYHRGRLEELPVQPGSADVIFCANVSQYLPDPVGTFASIGRSLKRGGLLAVKDMDFGTMRFPGIDAALQADVFQARARWERARLLEGYAFEDSWVGGKLAGYLRQAGYATVLERGYRIVRRSPLEEDFRSYLQGIAEWFVSEGAPFLDPVSRARWLELFQHGSHCALDRHNFLSEETEYVVTAVWPPPAAGST